MEESKVTKRGTGLNGWKRTRVAQGRRDQPIASGGRSRRDAGQLAFSSTSPEIGSLAQRQTLAARRKRGLASARSCNARDPAVQIELASVHGRTAASIAPSNARGHSTKARVRFRIKEHYQMPSCHGLKPQTNEQANVLMVTTVIFVQCSLTPACQPLMVCVHVHRESHQPVLLDWTACQFTS